VADVAFDPAPGQLSTSPPRAGVQPATPASERAYSPLVAEVAQRGALPTLADAATTTRATLKALGERLDAELRCDMARYLPENAADALLAVDASQRRGDLVALYQRVAVLAQDGASLHEIALRCAAVLAVLGETLPCSILERLTASLPNDISALVVLPHHQG
jgi:uncharacterized protein (DUF2267 family)